MQGLTVRVLFAAVLFISLFALATQEILDPDLFWHLRTGQLILETGSIPTNDPFSYTIPHRPWTTHEWLSEVILYAIYSLSGQEGLILFFAGIITVAFGLIYWLSPGKPYIAGLVTLLATLASAIAWGVRPQMFSLLLTAIILAALEGYRQGKERTLWLIPPLMVLWVNLHGGYLLGLALLGIYLGGAVISRWLQKESGPIRPLALAFVASLVATLFSPHGPAILVYPWITLTSPTMQSYIIEWQSPDFHQNQFLPFALLILLCIPSLAFSQKRPTATELLLLLAFGYASLRSARHIPLFALVAGPIISRHLEHFARSKGWTTLFSTTANRTRPGFALLNWITLLIVILGATLKINTSLTNNAAAQSKFFPVAAVDWMQSEGISGRIYNLYEWGGYLIWRLYPQQQVYIDGRADVYGDAFIEEYLDAYRMREGWLEPLQKYGVDLVLLDRVSPLANHLQADAAWERVYADDLAVILVKR